MKFSEKPQYLSGMLEVKFKGGAFSTWSDVFVRLEGRWMVMYKRERDTTRLAAIELGPGVEATDLADVETAQKFPRRFDVFCKGGLLPATEFIFRTKSRKDRDLWVHSIAANIHILDSLGLDPMFGVVDLDHVISRMREALTLTPIRIRSQLAVRCATGEEIVAFLVAEELAKDRSHANQIGRRLLSMNVIHHVVWEKDFLDSPDHYTIAELDDESNYVIEHFQKYMDSRRFWKYFDDDADSATGSGRYARSTASSGESNSITMRSSNVTLSSQDAKVGPPPPPPQVLAPTPPPPPAMMQDKKAKKCSVCGKSFNPLRRRYFCRQCTAVVCSHCSMSRKGEARDEGSGSNRICVSCKLSSANHAQDDFYDRIFSAPSSASTTSASDFSTNGNNGVGRAESFSHLSHSGSSSSHTEKRTASASNVLGGAHHINTTPSHFQATQQPQPQQQRRKSSSAHGATTTTCRESSGHAHECHLCMNEACAPLQDFYDVPYPVTQDHLSPTDRDVYLAALELEDEYERLRSVRILTRALETTSLKQIINQMCSMASIATSCPIVLVGLLESDEYLLCGQYGVPANVLQPVVGREVALAAHTCRNGSPIVCSDMNSDIRFAGNGWRRDVLRTTFYAGIPLQLSNGHIVGAIEVLDSKVRFACMDVLAQMQTIVKGVLRKFEEIVANAPPEDEYSAPTEPLVDPENGLDPLEVVERKPSTGPPPAMATPATAATPAATPAATATVTATEAAADGVLTQNEMEMRLMQLLSQTTTTQEQLRHQQGHMFTAINSHSKQISDLAKQLERMETTLSSKLDTKDNS